MLVRLGASPPGVDAEDADDKDAALQEDEGDGCDDDHRPAGAEHVVLLEVANHEH